MLFQENFLQTKKCTEAIEGTQKIKENSKYTTFCIYICDLTFYFIFLQILLFLKKFFNFRKIYHKNNIIVFLLKLRLIIYKKYEVLTNLKKVNSFLFCLLLRIILF